MSLVSQVGDSISSYGQLTSRVCAALTLPKVRLEIAQEEQANLSAGKFSMVQHDDVSPGVWISSGLDLEDHQCARLLFCLEPS